MTTKELIVLDIEEMLKSKIIEDLDKYILLKQMLFDLNNIEKVNFIRVKEVYLSLKKYYIFELNYLKNELTNEEILKHLKDSIIEKNFNNLFQLLNLLKKEDIKNLENDILELIGNKKEYINMYQEFIKENTNQEEEKKQLKPKIE